MTAEVRINDLFERFVQSNIRGKVVDCVQDIISSGIRGEVGAEQLKSAEIQVITLGPGLFLWNLPGRLHFSREDWQWLLAVLPTDCCNDRTVRDDFFFQNDFLLNWTLDLGGGFWFRLHDGHGVPGPDLSPAKFKLTHRWVLWLVDSFWASASPELICPTTQIKHTSHLLLCASVLCSKSHSNNCYLQVSYSEIEMHNQIFSWTTRDRSVYVTVGLIVAPVLSWLTLQIYDCSICVYYCICI